MVDEQEKLKGFDPSSVFQTCQQFLGGHWASASFHDFKFKVLSQGFGNRLFVCEISQHENDNCGSECPHKVLVRLYGGNVLPKDAPTRTLNETTETLVFYALGSKRFGPKLYGSFEGGRLEEFIESTAISIKDWCDDSNINKAVAKLVAEYHSQDFPLVRKPLDKGIPAVLDECMNIYETTVKDKLSEVVSPEEYEAAKPFFEFDVRSESQWISRVIPLLNSRVVFCHTDVNRGNLLHRTKDKKLTLVDYEFSGYQYRGIEIGNYFDMKIFDFGAEKLMTGYDYPKEEYRREFIEAYITHIKELGYFASNWDDTGRDSFNHIVMEAEFGSFVARLINIAWCLKDAMLWVKVIRHRREFDEDYDFGKSFNTFVIFYEQRKKQFLQSYPQFNF